MVRGRPGSWRRPPSPPDAGGELAEGEGFEPPIPCGIPVFKTGAFNRTRPPLRRPDECATSLASDARATLCLRRPPMYGRSDGGHGDACRRPPDSSPGRRQGAADREAGAVERVAELGLAAARPGGTSGRAGAPGRPRSSSTTRSRGTSPAPAARPRGRSSWPPVKPTSPAQCSTTRYGSSRRCSTSSALAHHGLQLVVGLGRRRHLHQLDLVELVLADHAPSCPCRRCRPRAGSTA